MKMNVYEYKIMKMNGIITGNELTGSSQKYFN